MGFQAVSSNATRRFDENRGIISSFQEGPAPELTPEVLEKLRETQQGVISLLGQSDLTPQQRTQLQARLGQLQGIRTIGNEQLNSQNFFGGNLLSDITNVVGLPLSIIAGGAGEIIDSIQGDNNSDFTENLGFGGQQQFFGNQLRNAGLPDDGFGGFLTDVAGFGLDVALDPLTYVGGRAIRGVGDAAGELAGGLTRSQASKQLALQGEDLAASSFRLTGKAGKEYVTGGLTFRTPRWLGGGTVRELPFTSAIASALNMPRNLAIKAIGSSDAALMARAKVGTSLGRGTLLGALGRNPVTGKAIEGATSDLMAKWIRIGEFHTTVRSGINLFNERTLDPILDDIASDVGESLEGLSRRAKRNTNAHEMLQLLDDSASLDKFLWEMGNGGTVGLANNTTKAFDNWVTRIWKEGGLPAGHTPGQLKQTFGLLADFRQALNEGRSLGDLINSKTVLVGPRGTKQWTAKQLSRMTDSTIEHSLREIGILGKGQGLADELTTSEFIQRITTSAGTRVAQEAGYKQLADLGIVFYAQNYAPLMEQITRAHAPREVVEAFDKVHAPYWNRWRGAASQARRTRKLTKLDELLKNGYSLDPETGLPLFSANRSAYGQRVAADAALLGNLAGREKLIDDANARIGDLLTRLDGEAASAKNLLDRSEAQLSKGRAIIADEVRAADEVIDVLNDQIKVVRATKVDSPKRKASAKPTTEQRLVQDLETQLRQADAALRRAQNRAQGGPPSPAPEAGFADDILDDDFRNLDSLDAEAAFDQQYGGLMDPSANTTPASTNLDDLQADRDALADELAQAKQAAASSPKGVVTNQPPGSFTREVKQNQLNLMREEAKVLKAARNELLKKQKRFEKAMKRVTERRESALSDANQRIQMARVTRRDLKGLDPSNIKNRLRIIGINGVPVRIPTAKEFGEMQVLDFSDVRHMVSDPEEWVSGADNFYSTSSSPAEADQWEFASDFGDEAVSARRRADDYREQLAQLPDQGSAEARQLRNLARAEDTKAAYHATHAMVGATGGGMIRVGVKFPDEGTEWLSNAAARWQNPEFQRNWNYTLNSQESMMTKINTNDGQLITTQPMAEYIHYRSQDMGELMKEATRGMAFFKRWATLSPAFHSRNFMGGMFNNVMAGVRMGDMRAWRRGVQALDEIYENQGRQVSVDQLGQELRSKLGNEEGQRMFQIVAGGDIFTARNNRIEDRLHSAVLGTDRWPTRAGAALDRGIGNTLIGLRSAGKRMDMGVETHLRGMLMMKELTRPTMKGLTGQAAYNSARDRMYQFHFDYSDLTEFEQGVRGHLAPFYTFASRNLGLYTELITQKPGLLPKMMQWQEQVEQRYENPLTPDYFNSFLNIPIPGSGLVLTPDFPINDLIRKGHTIQEEGVMRGTFNILAGDVAPWYTIAMETVSGRDTFTGAPIDTGANVPLEALDFLPNFITDPLRDTLRATEKFGAYVDRPEIPLLGSILQATTGGVQVNEDGQILINPFLANGITTTAPIMNRLEMLDWESIDGGNDDTSRQALFKSVGFFLGQVRNFDSKTQISALYDIDDEVERFRKDLIAQGRYQEAASGRSRTRTRTRTRGR